MHLFQLVCSWLVPVPLQQLVNSYYYSIKCGPALDIIMPAGLGQLLQGVRAPVSGCRHASAVAICMLTWRILQAVKLWQLGGKLAGLHWKVHQQAESAWKASMLHRAPASQVP